MSRDLEDSVHRWLALERASESEPQAERALVAVFAALPQTLPSAELVVRVMARARIDLFGRRWVQALVAAGVVGLTLSLALLPVSMWLAGRWLGVSGAVEAATQALLGLSNGIVRSLSIWHGLAELGATATMLVATPAGIWTLALVASLTALAALLLRGFLITPREALP